jgi:hypothetical protein
MNKLFASSVLVILTGAKGIQACDLCSVYSAAQAHGEIGKGIYAGVAEQFTHFGTIQVDGRRISNDAQQHLDSSISQVYAGYNINESVGLQLNVPMIARWYQRPNELGVTERGNVSGIGDVSLLAHFQAFRHESQKVTFAWTVLGGLKLPTGSSSRIGEELNEPATPPSVESGIHGHDLALGTGSVDGIVGTGIYGRWDRCFMTANMQYAIRTQGDFRYRYANDLTWFGGPGVYLLLKDHYTLGLQFVISGEDKGLDTFMGERAKDTGMTSVFLGPQVSFTWKEDMSTEFGFEFPVLRDNTALQAVPDWRLRAGLTWHF